jgi:hypothetical protein
MLANASGATAITGPGVEGRIFVLPGAAAKSDPKAVLAQFGFGDDESHRLCTAGAAHQA